MFFFLPFLNDINLTRNVLFGFYYGCNKKSWLGQKVTRVLTNILGDTRAMTPVRAYPHKHKGVAYKAALTYLHTKKF